MKISLQWLSEWADTGSDVRGLAHALTMVGLEVEGIQAAAPPLAIATRPSEAQTPPRPAPSPVRSGTSA